MRSTLPRLHAVTRDGERRTGDQGGKDEEFSDSTSELERDYATRMRQGRLVIRNASALGSESENEQRELEKVCERRYRDEQTQKKERRDSGRSRQGEERTPRTLKELEIKSPLVHSQQRRQHGKLPVYAKNFGSSKPSVGLGLHGLGERRTVEDEESMYEYEAGYEKEWSRERQASKDHRALDESDIYHEDDHHSPSRSPHRSRSRSRSPYQYATSPYEDHEPESDFATHPDRVPIPSTGSANSAVGRRRREEALIGLVNGLQFDLPGIAPLSPRPRANTVHALPDQQKGHDSTHARRNSGRKEYAFAPEEPTTRDDPRKAKNRLKKKDREREADPPSRLSTSSKVRIEDLARECDLVAEAYSVRKVENDHRRSASLPPKSRGPSQTENRHEELLDVKEEGTDTDYGVCKSQGVETIGRKERRRSSTSAGQMQSQPQPQPDVRRRSIIEETSGGPPRLSGGRRRSSTYTAENSAPRAHDKRSSIVEKRDMMGKRTSVGERRGLVHERERERGRERSGDLARREREAFGIPESLSYSGYEVHSPASPHRHPDSFHEDPLLEPDAPEGMGGQSTPESERWVMDANESSAGFSTAAQALFGKLEGGTTSKDGEQRPSGLRHSKRDHDSESMESRRFSASRGASTSSHARARSIQGDIETRRPERVSGTMSASSSAPSLYDEAEEYHKEVLPQLRRPHPTPAASCAQSHRDARESYDRLGTSWRATMHPATYDSLIRIRGDCEMDRQELIYAFTRAHAAFVRHLRTIVKIFVVPLRRKHSKVWLPGVPSDVARVFDWLEDILVLHASLADALEVLTEPWNREDVVLEFAKEIRSFVPRLEVYQPYIVRVESVRETILKAREKQEEFGEFVALREKMGECGGMSLADLLLLPVKQLHTSVETFKVSQLL